MPDRPIRILRLIARLNVGGPSIHTILLTKRMEELGYQTRLVSGRESSREGNMYGLAEEHGVEPRFIEELGREIQPRRDYASYKAICREIREFKPDIIHTHTAKAGTLGRLAARRCGVPIVVHTFHGHVLHGYFGWFKNKFYRQVEKILARFSDRLVAVSDAGRAELSGMGVAPLEKFTVIPLGLDLERFRGARARCRGRLRAELGFSEKEYLVGIVARLAPVKNHLEFFAAAERLVPDHPDMRFLVIGDGPLRSELEEFVNSKPSFVDKLLFLGMRDDLETIYGDLDLAVLTSKNEGLPVALIEALSAGVPILGSNVGATYELASSYWGGGVYPPGEVDHLVGGILEAYGQREGYQRITNEMKGEIIRRYSIDRLVKDLDGLYQDLLKSKGIVE